MKDIATIKERYMRDPLAVRLGGLAANLARAAAFSEKPEHKDIVEGILNESKFFIEWTAPEAKPDTQSELVELQIQIAIWQQSWNDTWNDETLRATVAEKAKRWSELILGASGLLG